MSMLINGMTDECMGGCEDTDDISGLMVGGGVGEDEDDMNRTTKWTDKQTDVRTN